MATAWGTREYISVGDVQWMTAGSGIIHQEMPRETNQAGWGGFSSGQIFPHP